MSRQEAREQYAKALRLGQKNYKECVVLGRYPYPQVLDEILNEAFVAGQVEMGIIEIPTEQIVGTKTAGRRSAFAANFMPLLDLDSEFSTKWISLCADHLGDEGIRDPIRCFEYLGRFYVQEGNKRVSVLKSYDAPTIPGYVIRMIPKWNDDPAVQAYYDFMASYQLTGLYRVYFSRAGSFPKLQAALGFEADHVWTADERQHFIAGFTFFRDAYRKQGGGTLPITPADALLVWLRVYDFEQLWKMPAAELAKSIAAVWPDMKLAASAAPIDVSTETEEQKQEETSPNLLGRFLKAMFPSHLNIAFINEGGPETSDWTRAHDLGRQYLEAVMEDKVTTQVFNNVDPGESAENAIDEAVENGAQVVFATTPPLIGACRKAAAKHPGLRVLNCSASMPYAGVRTYYSRIYEGKFITGAIAGAMSRDGHIGYVGSNPIFGVPAGINAFALGARLTNPRARIRLRWSCVEEDALGALAQEGADLISNRDIPTPDRVREPWGLCLTKPDGTLESLASPYWHWGNFYVKLVRSMFSGGWDALSSRDDERAVNYWWGMSSRAVGVLLSQKLPAGVTQLVHILQKGVTDGSIEPFRRPICSQDGQIRNDGEKWFSPAEILHMDWLCDCVDGSIPAFEELLPRSRPIVRLQGVYRDKILPEKEGPVL
ncbi:MAG: BMP family ABC transporter substrate-binding protein [Oscillospiraceae bacterium]|jgi:basic membrane protein A|nr:BMP family ABC transporter substrate-binding protein [Oscillospiraceae bacterium]